MENRERGREKKIWLVISFLVVLVLCVWFVVHNDSVRGWIMPPFYESFELVPSEVLRSSVGRSLFMAIRCTRHASEKRIKKIIVSHRLRHYFARCGDCQRFIGNFNIIVKNLRAQKNISNENRILSSLVETWRWKMVPVMMSTSARTRVSQHVDSWVCCRFLLCVNHVRIDCSAQ